jgi:hypothetical protein
VRLLASMVLFVLVSRKPRRTLAVTIEGAPTTLPRETKETKETTDPSNPAAG